MKNIILIGLPGSGKTTFGRALAGALGKNFIDADDYLVEKEGKTIPELFAVSEECFRDAEERTIAELAAREDLVIATGGGVVKRPANVARLRDTGLVIFLDRSPADIAADVEVETRPLLAEGAEKIYRLYDERIGAYRAAAHTVVANDDTEEEILRRLIEEAGT